MSRIGLVFLLISLTGRCFSQDYFVLIQADNKQPFYVRLGDKSMSSSAEGTLILGQLRDSTYSITVGFPGQSSSDQLFRIDMHHKDQQFLLRNQEDKGWILYNPLTSETKTTEPKVETGAELKPQGIKKDDAFSRLMAGVVHDTAVMYNTYATDQTLHDSAATAGTPGQKPSGTPVHPSDSASSTIYSEKSTVSGQPPAAMVPATNVAGGLASPAKTPVTGQPARADSSTRPTVAPPTANAAAGDAANPGGGVIKGSSVVAGRTPVTGSPVEGSSVTGTPVTGSPVTSPKTPATSQTVINPAGAGLSASTGNAAAAPIDTLAAIRALRDSLRRMVEGTNTRTQVQANTSASPAASPKLDSTPVADSSAMAAPPPPVRPAIIKLSERKLTRSLRLVYADKAAGQKTDTIVMLIPLDTLAKGKTHNPAGPVANVAGAKTGHPVDTLHRTISRTAAEPANDPASVLKTIPSTTPAASGTPAGSGGNSVAPATIGSTTPTRSSVPTGSPVPTGTPVTSSTSPAGETAKTKPDTTRKSTPIKSALPFINSDCHAFATDYDVDRLRVKMLQSSKDEDRIQVARRIFKTKCFSTRQIKTLSEVFSTDAQKYKFYETAYPFASDDQFRELGSTLADPVFSSKFKTMTGQ